MLTNPIITSLIISSVVFIALFYYYNYYEKKNKKQKEYIINETMIIASLTIGIVSWVIINNLYSRESETNLLEDILPLDKTTFDQVVIPHGIPPVLITYE